ncbi:MAG: hypothetical protein JNK37_07730 [Verrucomicrobiales bacterium]|nr:hypothetical protein [Verrucomicrobiales bacterium]
MDEPPTLAQVAAAIRSSWGAETAHAPAAWSADCPSAGQCWTSAFVIRHYFGGEIILAEVLPHSDPIQRHAWNRLPDGSEFDLTRDQFPPGQTFRECVVPESVIRSVSGPQAEELLRLVTARIALDRP